MTDEKLELKDMTITDLSSLDGARFSCKINFTFNRNLTLDEFCQACGGVQEALDGISAKMKGIELTNIQVTI